MRWYENAFLFTLNLSFFLFVIILVGVININTNYLDELNSALVLFVSLFLILRYNPYYSIIKRSPKFDKIIAFRAGVFLLLTTSIAQLAIEYFKTKTGISL